MARRNRRSRKKYGSEFRSLYIGIDTHLNSYSLVTYDYQTDEYLYEKKITSPTDKDVLDYVHNIQDQFDEKLDITVGYEAGYTGFGLMRYLKNHRIKACLLAPHTIKRSEKEKKRKNDRRDAKLIAKSLATNDYSDVYVPSPTDEAVRDIIRLRETSVKDLRRVKQQILAFCTRRELNFDLTKTYFSQKHISWLKKLKLENDFDRYSLKMMIEKLEYFMRKVKEFDEMIATIAKDPLYKQKVDALKLIRGVSTLIALAVIVEVGDFRRFAKANCFSAFLGLTPKEHSSGEKNPDLGITKQGNKFLRKLLVQAAQVYSRGDSITKSKEVLKFEATMSKDLVLYADRARMRLHNRYLHLSLGLHKAHQKVVCAIAREIACFIWGMMTGNIH